MAYDDAKYNVIERKWFGLHKKMGGDVAAPLTCAAAAEAAQVTRWYPKGDIVIKKFGLLTVATGGDGEQLFVLKKGNYLTGTRIAQVMASTDAAPFTFASDVTMSSANVAAGSYLSIMNSSNVCSTGSHAVFIDFVRKFRGDSASDKWSV